MANTFLTGTRPIASGLTEMTVSGLSLSFAPSCVLVNVRQPSDDSPLVSAYVVGTPTQDGFSVAFSSPVTKTGYILDFTAFSEGGGQHVDGDSLAVSYEDLKKSVSRFLGYDPASLSDRQASEVDDIIQSGIRNFYYPPALNGVDANFEWSFIRQDGTVMTADGVSVYELPNGFGRMAGQIRVDGDCGKTIPLIPFGDIMRMISSHERGRPRFASVVFDKTFGDRGQKKRLYLFPEPDREYSLSFRCDADTGKIDAKDNPFPLGGPMYAELVRESCLAQAEQTANDEIGLHTQNFNTLLVSMIQRDRKDGAQNFGRMSSETMW